MKKKGYALSVTAIICMAFLVGSAVFALQEGSLEVYKGKMKDVMVMKSTKVIEKHTKPIISFPHKKHNVDYKLKCEECHHVYKEGKNTWKVGDPVKKCGECHNKPGKPPKELKDKPKEAILYLQEALHQNCIGCHKEVKKKDKTKKTVPVTCTKCHVKPKKK